MNGMRYKLRLSGKGDGDGGVEVMVKEELCKEVVEVRRVSDRVIGKEVRKTCTERRKISLINDVKIRKGFEEKVSKLVDVGAPNLWGHFMDGVLMACEEVCGWKRRRRSKGDTVLRSIRGGVKA